MENYPETKVLSLAGKDDHGRHVSEHEFVGRNARNERVLLGELQNDENAPSIPVHRSDNSMSLQKEEEKEDTGRSLVREEEKTSDHDGPTVEREPGIHDVLLGRGAKSYNHVGNILFRKLVKAYKAQYFNASKTTKPIVTSTVVHLWRHLSPPGRFLRTRSEGNWVEVGDHDARKKTAQCLRERAKDVQPIVQRIQLQKQEQKKAILSAASNVHQPSSFGNAFVTPTGNPHIIMSLPEMHQLQQNRLQQQFLLHRRPPMLSMCTFAPGIVNGAPMMSAFRQPHTNFGVPQQFVFGNSIPQRIRQLDNIQNNNSASMGVMYPSTTHMTSQPAKVGEKKNGKKNGGNQSM
eukprot:scaffold474080_cov63-Attheya_sp.AAC.3